MGERTLLRWWRAPLWPLALGTGAKSFVDNPILGSERAQPPRASRRSAEARPSHGVVAPPPAGRAQCRANGANSSTATASSRSAISFPPTTFAKLQQALLNGEFEAREQQQGDTITRRVPIGPELLKRVPELRAMLGSTALAFTARLCREHQGRAALLHPDDLTGQAEARPTPSSNFTPTPSIPRSRPGCS